MIDANKRTLFMVLLRHGDADGLPGPGRRRRHRRDAVMSDVADCDGAGSKGLGVIRAA